MAPSPCQAARVAMNTFFTDDREVDLESPSEDFVAALTTFHCLEDMMLGERQEMLDAASKVFDTAATADTWAMRGLMGHPHGKAYVASLKAEVAKTNFTVECEAKLVAIKTRIIKELDLCCPNLAECPPNAAESLIGTLNEMRDILKKTRAFDCHVHLLPNAEGMNTCAVATRVYETMPPFSNLSARLLLPVLT